MLKHLFVSIKMLAIMTVLTGIIYPLLITGFTQAAFHHQANGSLILNNGKIQGSELIGQCWDDPKYFFGRPSATSPACNGSGSSGSNQGPTNKALVDTIKSRADALQALDPDNHGPIPADLVMASGSGLDPQISIAAAKYQVERIARVRNLPKDELSMLVDQFTQSRDLKFMGQPRVNVLELNIVLDQYKAGDIAKIKPVEVKRGLITKATIF